MSNVIKIKSLGYACHCYDITYVYNKLELVFIREKPSVSLPMGHMSHELAHKGMRYTVHMHYDMGINYPGKTCVRYAWTNAKRESMCI